MPIIICLFTVLLLFYLRLGLLKFYIYRVNAWQPLKIPNTTEVNKNYCDRACLLNCLSYGKNMNCLSLSLTNNSCCD